MLDNFSFGCWIIELKRKPPTASLREIPPLFYSIPIPSILFYSLTCAVSKVFRMHYRGHYHLASFNTNIGSVLCIASSMQAICHVPTLMSHHTSECCAHPAYPLPCCHHANCFWNPIPSQKSGKSPLQRQVPQISLQQDCELRTPIPLETCSMLWRHSISSFLAELGVQWVLQM